MPGISDPGYELVKACVEAEIPVVPIPGPVAAITALSAAGYQLSDLYLKDFTEGGDRHNRLEFLQARTIIFYEAPHRLTNPASLSRCFGARSAVGAGTLTKLHEEFWGRIGMRSLTIVSVNLKGEYTLVVAGLPLARNCQKQN